MNDNVLNRQFLETGSEEALSLLMQVHYEPIRAYITKIIGNPHDADEIRAPATSTRKGP